MTDEEIAKRFDALMERMEAMETRLLTELEALADRVKKMEP